MKRITVFAALLALSLAPALQAQYRGNRDRDSYRYSYPNSGQMERVAALAHEIDDVATSIRRQAERNNRRPDRDEARMLADLRELDGRASHFHAQVESYRQDPRHTADDFAALEDAFFRLGETLRYVNRRPYIDRGLDRIYPLMNELSRYYGRSGYDRRGYDRYGQDRYGDGRDRYDGRSDRRYGHDRYGDDDRDRYDDPYRPPHR
jgi:hypothetical protein